MIIIKMLKNFALSKKMTIFVIQKKQLKLTIMKQNYRIRIFTTSGVIERLFYRRDIAISTIKEFKERFNDFMIGILSERINGEWIPVYSINNNNNN